MLSDYKAPQNRLKYRMATFKVKEKNHSNFRMLKYTCLYTERMISEKNSQTAYKEILLSSYKSQAIKTF